MSSGKQTHVLYIAAALMLLAAVYVFMTHSVGSRQITVASSDAIGLAESAGKASASTTSIVSRPAIVGDDEIHMMAGYFRQEYGARISNPYWQLKMLERLMLLLKKKYPQDWESHLREILLLAFPDLAEMLLKKLAAFNEYSDWIGSLKGNMQFADQAERRKAMWDKRVALFGEEAYVIWEALYKNEQFADRLAMVDQSSDGFQEKSQHYIAAMKEIYGANALEGGHSTQKMGVFLELPSVQQALVQMPASQRKEELRQFRSAMGLDETALNRWDALDNERDQVRSAGTRYMQERELLMQNYKGDALDNRLHDLQDRMFGQEEAIYIRNEEASGYYRFNSPQKIGFN